MDRAVGSGLVRIGLLGWIGVGSGWWKWSYVGGVLVLDWCS